MARRSNKSSEMVAALRMQHRVKLDQIRSAVADYMRSEGCSCCRNGPAHDKHRARLGELLGVKGEPSGIPDDKTLWYDFAPFQSQGTGDSNAN